MPKRTKKTGILHPVATGIKKLGSKELAAYLDLYHLLDAGWKVVSTYAGICESGVDRRIVENVQFIYSWLRKLFVEVRDSFPSLAGYGKHSTFDRFTFLTAVTQEEFESWFSAETVDVDPAENVHIITAEQRYDTEMTFLRDEMTVRGGIKTFDLPKGSKIKEAYNAAMLISTNVRNAKRLMSEEIVEYSLSYDENAGRLLINGQFELATPGKDTAAGDVAKEIVKHATPTGEPSFTPTYRKTSQSLGTIINQRLNISGTTKDIFLKGTKRNVLRSRSPVSRKTLLDEGVDLFELDLDLLRAGVSTVPKGSGTVKAKK